MGPLLLVAAAFAAQSGERLPQSVAEATFDVCFRAVSGEVQLTDAQAMRDFGYVRASPAVEAQVAASAPQPDRPVVVSKGTGSQAVVVLHWPGIHTCSITFDGPEAVAAMEAIRTRLRADAGLYREHPEPVSNALANGEAYQTQRNGRSLVLVLMTPRAADNGARHSVVVQSQEI